MPIRPIVRLGHPALRSVAKAVAAERIGEAVLQELVEDMLETMRAAHGVGLAAPQVETSLQIFVYEVAPPSPAEIPEPSPPIQDPHSPQPLHAHPPPGSSEREAVQPIPLRVVINPMLTPQTGEQVYDWEGCLSIPDLRGLVPRHPAVRVRGLDRLGQPLDYVAKGFEARIVQHEFDHLNGVVFLDRMRGLKALAFREEWERYMAAGAADLSPDSFDPPAPRASTAPLNDTAEAAPVRPGSAAAPAPVTPEVI